MSSQSHYLWAIVLAAGSGSRLTDLTRVLHGEPRPKQFASFSADGRSMLQLTLAQIEPVVPSERIVVVVPSENLALAERQLTSFPGVTIIPEPATRGSAATLLLSLAFVLERESSADVLVVPVAQVVSWPEALQDGVSLARAALGMAPITLLGVAATSFKKDLCWIVPGRTITSGIRSVATFVSSPYEQLARHLLEKGALWHTLFTVAEASTLWRVSERHLAAQAAAIRAAVAEHASDAVGGAYDSIRPADFAQSVVGRQLGVAVADVTASGFTHIATVEDVLGKFPNIGDKWPARAGLERSPRRLERRALTAPPQ